MEGDVFDFPGEEGNENDLVPSREAHIALREGNYVRCGYMAGNRSRFSKH